jgi:predicted O-linked N-acetylglucosamine transferase (SPINDLY family)/glycosyltransferase involved in cell wall biosynthesis
MTSARRKFLSLAKKGFIPGVCFHHIGECYLDEKKFEDAKKYYKKALVHLPDSFRIWNRLAKVHQELGDKSDEINVLQKTLSLSPQNSSTFLTLFQSLVGIGSWTKAYQLCIRSKGIQIPPEHLLDFSKACIESGDIKSAIISLNKLISKRHDVAEAYFLKGNIMVLLKEFSKAVECYMKALDYREDWPEALSNLYNSKTFLCDWSERKKELENLQAFHETGSILGGAFELAGLYWSEEEESKYAQMRSGKIVADAEAIRRRLNFVYKLQKRTKKRIGFLSSDFRNHAVGHQIVALFENLDSEKYELFIYATSPSEDFAVRKRIENISKNFKNLSSFSLVNKAIAIHRDELDLLVDLGGFSRGHNAQLLALRPAVKQAHYLGYASSMGAEFVDYMIADVTVIPPSSSKFYGEKVVRMSGCFFPPGDFQGFAKRAKRKEVGLPSRGIVYCAFHAAYKLDPDIWGCWMRILKAVPESVLWLKFKPADDALKNLKADAVRLGVSSKRIILAEDLPDREAHLSRMAVADLYLDCPLYNGHASAMDALRTKLPILTVKGNRFCNRVGESFCKNLDLQEMICKDLRKYEEKAIELGLRPSKLLTLRKKIQENAESVLSPIEHTKRFEEALDIILGKPKKVARKSAHFRPKKSRDSMETDTNYLGDFSLVMIRPQGISNWAYNVSMLADELAKKGGATIVIESPTSQSKKTDFSKSVKVLFSTEQSFSQAINHAICEADSRYIFYLDDPLRVLPVAYFIETMEAAMDALCQGKVGILGVCSSMEPHTGCLVTRSADAKKQNVKVTGFFSPSFVLNIDAVLLTGGLRKFGDSMALSVLDLSLRFEKEGYRSSLIQTDRVICPAHSGKEYLSQSSKSDLTQFLQLWNRKPSSLKPKYPPKDEQVGETADYQEWIRLCDTITEGDILAFRKEADDLHHKPLISVVMPVFNPPKKFLMKAIESVISQAYENWELCIADDASTKKYIRPLLESYASKDSRVKVTFRKTNGHISVASNSAIKLTTGHFVAFLDHDDELRPHSLLEVAKVINQYPDVKLIYSDEDKIDEHGERYDPCFKPDWNPDLLLGQNYISHFSVFDGSLLRKLKGLRKGYEGSQDWDLTLRFTEQIKKTCILHIPKVLYHWRALRGSSAVNVAQKKYIFNATKKVLNDTLARRQIKGSINFIFEDSNYTNIDYHLDQSTKPMVSILIPTKDHVNLLEKCITSILGTIECKKYRDNSC